MIIIKSQHEIEKMRQSNILVAGALNRIRETIEIGITTLELDEIAESYLLEYGAKPAFKGYRGFPNTLCASINCGVVHGIPSPRQLKSGDIISLDLGSFYEGYYGDAAITIPIGEISKEANRLLDVTENALSAGIEKARAGNRLSDISYAIQSLAESNGYSVVREFVGHGIGTLLHEEPQVPNFGSPGTGPILKKGMVLALEPMINVGKSDVEVLEDNWTVVTADRSLSAHFEHTIAVTDGDADILSIM